MLKGSDLPSVKALRTFIAVANNMSFSKAADELSITQGAVSKQISALEQQLGQPLFQRQLNGIELTIAGKQYLPKVTQALEIIQYATASLIQTDQLEEVLTVNVTPSFASLWLITHIESFNCNHKNIRIRIKTGDGIIRRMDSDTEVMIRCLPISKHYENATMLQNENLILVASRALIEKEEISAENDLHKLMFLPQVTRPHLWPQFKKNKGLAFEFQYHSVGFEHFYMSLEAVKSGVGLALLPDFMVQDLIDRGELINPFGLSMKTNYGYYVHVPSYKMASRKIHDFTQWLKQQLGTQT
jgi:DNA-binding transcriptional LysR family regulator